MSRILTEFEQLNPDWLLLGKGEMLRGSASEKPSNATIDRLLERIEDLARENGRLQAEIDELKKGLASANHSEGAYVATAAG